MMSLTTEELKNYIMDKVKCIQGADAKYVYFSDKTNSEEGVYVYFDGVSAYHYAVSERGTVVKHKVTDSIFEITFWVLDTVVGQMAYEGIPVEIKNSDDNDAYRKFAFNKKLILFAKVGENYRKAEELAIEEILRVSPYQKS